ncbi:hypothetical protein IAD21_03134 [Abditibacteriota bacterium]|nr:hypothetical protein IAD21_03134 [Abditibacteriota bacterium]
MSQDIEIYALTHWSELKEAATKTPLCDIDLAPFWGSGMAQLTFISPNGWYEFRRECDSVAALCPATLDQ